MRGLVDLTDHDGPHAVVKAVVVFIGIVRQAIPGAQIRPEDEVHPNVGFKAGLKSIFRWIVDFVRGFRVHNEELCIALKQMDIKP